MLLAGLKAGLSFSETKSKCSVNDNKLGVENKKFTTFLHYLNSVFSLKILWILQSSKLESNQPDMFYTSCIQSR